MLRLFKYQTVTQQQWLTFNHSNQKTSSGSPIIVSSNSTFDSSKKYWIQLESSDIQGESSGQRLGGDLDIAKSSSTTCRVIVSSWDGKTEVLTDLAVQDTGNVLPTATPAPTPTHTPTPSPTPTTYPWSSGNYSILLDNDQSTDSVSNCQHIKVSNNGISIPNTFSISCWINGSSFSSSARNTIAGSIDPSDHYIQEHNGAIIVSFGISSNQKAIINPSSGSSSPIDNSSKSLFTITVNGIDVSVYKNDLLWGVGSIPTTPGAFNLDAIGGHGVVNNPSKPAGKDLFKGKIHEYVVFGEVLNSTAVANLYNSGTVLDASTISNNILLWYRMGNINFDGSTSITTIEDASIYNNDGILKVGLSDYSSPGNNTGPEFTNFV